MLKRVKPDEKGRVALGKLAQDVDSFEIEEDKDGRIILIPYVSIPKREVWLYKNHEALESVKRGLVQAKKGELYDLGDFSQYAKD